MIKLTQIKIPMQAVMQVSPIEYMKTGKLSDGEKKLVCDDVIKRLHISQDQLDSFQILRRSIDARKKQNIVFSYSVLVSCKNEEKICRKLRDKNVQIMGQDIMGEVQKTTFVPTNPVVVGLGPAGLFAALFLARAGAKPIVLERGQDVDTRQKIVAHFHETGELDCECNVQFGEGGAGTFSDGKLNTLVKDPTGRGRKVLETFVEHGAPEEILYLQKPHIGTDKLGAVVKSIREEIIRLGGEVIFGAKFVSFEKDDSHRVKSVTYHKLGQDITISANYLILATGHSARDTFTYLFQTGLTMEPKAFAIGVRMEHPQEMIGKNQYGCAYDSLPPADYKLTYTASSGRGVYSFCMCPGGQVVNASSETNHLVVNGMSNYARDGRNANSAIVVTISPKDFGSDEVLAGMNLQRQLESLAYQAGKGAVPVQLLGDFMEGKLSTCLGEVIPDVCGAYCFADVRGLLPDYVRDAMIEAIPEFDKKIPGYGRKDAVVLGVETRTSSPVRILRDETCQSNIKGLFPCGEGAGYAGGITSAAMDGIRVADMILFNNLQNK